MHYLKNRIAKLESCWEAEAEAEADYPTTRYNLLQAGDPLPPDTPPGTVVYHLDPATGGWTGIVGEDGVERWVSGEKPDVSS